MNMVAVTIGVGEYRALAERAAGSIRQMTGLDTIILDDAHFASSGYKLSHFLKLKLFDLVRAEWILYFDADIVSLAPWNPRIFAERNALIAVADRPGPISIPECRLWGFPVSEYFNAGFLILNRDLHSRWLVATDEFAKSQPPMPFPEQSPMNIMRHRLGLKIDLLDRRYNWVGYGHGSLCYRMPVFMAHTLNPHSKMANLDYFEGRFDLGLAIDIGVNEQETALLKEQYVTLVRGFQPVTVLLARNGTVQPRGTPLGGDYWFVRDSDKGPVLVIASEGEIVLEFVRCSSHVWESEQPMAVDSGPVCELSSEIVANRWFSRYIDGEKRGEIELIAGGEIGFGASVVEQFWYVQNEAKGPVLAIGANGQVSYFLKLNEEERIWEGRFVKWGRNVVRLLPRDLRTGRRVVSERSL